MKKMITTLLCVLITATMLFGCSNKEDNNSKDNTGSTETNNTASLKVALCVSGSVNDLGWNQSAYEGLLEAKALGCETAYTENLGAADIAAAYTDYAASGYDVIFGHGYEFGDPAIEVAKSYPNVKFVVIEGEVSAENVASYQIGCNEVAYINGMLAASLTETGKVGIIGPLQGGSLVKIVNGFEDGAKSINPNIEVQTAWTQSFTDTALAKEVAQAMIDSGVDIIGHCANESGTGAINAAKAAGIYAIGDSYDQHELAPETILTSAIYNVPALVKKAMEDIINGTFVGEINSYGMADGIVELAPYYDMDSVIPSEVKELISTKMEEIKSGTFEVPFDAELRN